MSLEVKWIVCHIPGSKMTSIRYPRKPLYKPIESNELSSVINKTEHGCCQRENKIMQVLMFIREIMQTM